MKKNLLALGLLALSLGGLRAQNIDAYAVKDGGEHAEDLIHKGVNTINLYYGVSISHSIYKAVASDAAIGLKFSGIGPMGIVYEHLMTDVVGLGVELGYSSLKMDYNFTDSDPNTGQEHTYTATWKFSTIRAMLRANFHFAHSEHFDAYGFVSAGYRNSNFSFSTNDPNYSGKTSFNGIIPFGLKPGIGFRYFFTDNFGLNAEIAIGTPVLGGGVSFKF